MLESRCDKGLRVPNVRKEQAVILKSCLFDNMNCARPPVWVYDCDDTVKVMAAEEYGPVLKQWNIDETSITKAHESELAERKYK